MTTLFVSDLHLDAQQEAATRQFIGWLRDRAPGAEALYVLGDLFESWVGDDDQDAHRERVCAALRALSGSGVPLYVMHGNRDFLLGAAFARRTGARLLPDPVLLERHGERALLTHGDALCSADHAYQRLRALVRAPGWQHRFLALPLRLRRLLAAQARAGSRRHTGHAPAAIMDVDETTVAAAMRACGVRLLIHGHTHRPAVHEFLLDGLPARRIVLGDWHTQGSCLRWEETGPRLEALPRAA